MLLKKYKSTIVLIGMLSLVFLGLTAYGLGQQAPKEKTPDAAKPSTQTPASKDGEEVAKKHQDDHYGWLAFGPEKKVRVLVRLKGDEVAFDLDGDGKFESKGERFESEKDCKDIVLSDPDSKKSYVITEVHVLHIVPPTKYVYFRVNIKGTETSFPQGGLVRMAVNPKNAPQAHFYGPLAVTPHGKRIINRASLVVKSFENDLVDIRALMPQFIFDIAGTDFAADSALPKFLKRNESTNLLAMLQTEGEDFIVGASSSGVTDNQRRDIAYAPFPKGIHPFVDVEFPPKQQGGQPIKKRFPLDQFCYDGLYGGPVQVPADAGSGKAKATFSFEEWKGIKAAPTTVEIPIDESQKEK
jgi:hypothetical protein